MMFEELETGTCLAGLDSTEDLSPRSDVASRDVERAVRLLIRSAGDDPDRKGLVETPARVARAYREWFAGYAIDPRTLLSKVFTDAEDYDETVLLRNIPLVSTCEHHLAPITGYAHVGYRPSGRVVGISKLARVVDAYARRMQLQERLTQQIARTLDEVLQPLGVAVIIEASHGCMSSRGVNHQGVSMVTKCWLGDFKTMPELRRDMMESIAGCRGRS